MHKTDGKLLSLAAQITVRGGVEGEGTLRAHQVERQEKKKQKDHATPKGKKNAKLNLD